MRAALLVHGSFGLLSSKTAACILRYRGTYDPVAVIDGSLGASDAGDVVGDIGKGVPIVPSMEKALALRPQVLVIGIAPRGGVLPASWRTDLETALDAGVHVHSGLHTFLADDAQLAARAARSGAQIWDVRRPRRPPRITSGAGRGVRSYVVHTMGTDCNSGKMTTTVEMVRKARERGWHAAFAATGQTGIMIGCDAGAPIDRVVSDFVAGAAEELVLDLDARGFDVVMVEGQGALTHPAYSGVTLGLAHGCFPDAVVLCHQPGRRFHTGYESEPHAFPLVSLEEMMRRIEDALRPTSGGRVVAVSLATFHMGEQEARAAIVEAKKQTGLPATDPVRFGPGPLLDAVRQAAASGPKQGGQRLAA